MGSALDWLCDDCVIDDGKTPINTWFFNKKLVQYKEYNEVKNGSEK